jgi:hypothetical protein
MFLHESPEAVPSRNASDKPHWTGEGPQKIERLRRHDPTGGTMRLGEILAAFMVLTCAAATPATGPATRPATQPADRVASAKARLAAAYTTMAEAQKRYDDAKSAALAPFDASAQGQSLAADVAAKGAALDALRDSRDTAARDRANAAFNAAQNALRDARSAVIKQDRQARAAAAALADAGAAVRRAKAVLKEAARDAEARRNREEDAADPTARHKREVAAAIAESRFIEGMTESEADQSAKTLDNPGAPAVRSVENDPNGDRFVRYVAYRRGESVPDRWVTLKVHGGVVVDVKDITHDLPQQP